MYQNVFCQKLLVFKPFHFSSGDLNEPPEPPLDPPQIQYNSHVQYCRIVVDSYLCSWQTIHSVQIIIIVSVQYTELLRTVPLIIVSGHSMESVNNVHVFLLTFYLCSLFQQWMHQDFASQSKCSALVTSSAFRCAFKELFVKFILQNYFHQSSQQSQCLEHS